MLTPTWANQPLLDIWIANRFIYFPISDLLIFPPVPNTKKMVSNDIAIFLDSAKLQTSFILRLSSIPWKET